MADRSAAGPGADPPATEAEPAASPAESEPSEHVAPTPDDAVDHQPDVGADDRADVDRAVAARAEERDGEREPLAGFAAFVFAIGLLAGALLVGFLWGTLGSGGDRNAEATAPRTSAQRVGAGNPTVLGTEASEPTPSAQADKTESPAGATTAAAAGQSVAEACSQVVAARREALGAAKPAMDQWAVHIGAMNKLVVGAITLAQANAFWASTRVAAHRKIHDFQAADDRARSLTVQCPPARLVDDAAATACARTAEQQGAALDRARAAVKTWKKHVGDMEMLRMGHLSPAMATKMWLASWHRGAEELHAYREASAKIRAGDCTA